MNVAHLVASRTVGWQELETLCGRLEGRRQRKLAAGERVRFASLYRAACADLALADSYQLPPATVRYLHQLVGRAHNQLYRSRRFNFHAWREELLVNIPRRLFHDGTLRLAFVIFWGSFLAAFFLSSQWSPVSGFAEQVVGQESLVMFEEMYADPVNSRGGATGRESIMFGFYINHNTSIGLRCFAMGLLFGIGGIFATLFNAIYLGTVFGYMSTLPESEHFFHFVTAHGPFELTAIVLSAAAGMRLGFSLVDTGGLARRDSLLAAAREAMPSMGAAMLLFFLAALLEGFLSPSAAPYEVKATVGGFSVLLLTCYFVVLGYSEQPDS